MDGLKGLHALSTFVITLFVAWASWLFVNSYFGNITDTIFKSVLWLSYILVILLGTIIIPSLIAFSENNDSSIISYMKGVGAWGIGVLFTTVFYRIIILFTGDGSSAITTILTEGLHIKIMSFIWILAMLFGLFLMPVIVSAMPNISIGDKQ